MMRSEVHEYTLSVARVETGLGSFLSQRRDHRRMATDRGSPVSFAGFRFGVFRLGLSRFLFREIDDSVTNEGVFGMTGGGEVVSRAVCRRIIDGTVEGPDRLARVRLLLELLHVPLGKDRSRWRHASIGAL